MVPPDFRSARGSNTGDDFHELLALRRALALLDQDAELIAVAVEGLRAQDESGTPRDTWDGVDCTLYYGGDHAATAAHLSPGLPLGYDRLTPLCGPVDGRTAAAERRHAR